MIHCLDNPSRSANIAIKVDFAKVFARISWQFLEASLNSFGFSSQSCHLLLSTLKATHFSILIKGSPHGFFRMKRGVKQGDPLSPLLFILGNEGLSRMIKGKVEEGYLKAIQTGRSKPPSHLAYADDIIFFLNGHFRNLLRFKGIIDCFLNSSGHMINLNKSHFYTGPRVKPEVKANMQRALQMGEGRLPLNYLGATIGKGKLRKEDCKKIVQHFDAYLNTWYSKVLNQMGRLILIKHVLSSIPLHIVAVQQMPKSIHNMLNKKMQNFLWGYKEGRPKYHWELDHTLFHCQMSFKIWRFFSAAFNGPVPNKEETLHETCMKWWKCHQVPAVITHPPVVHLSHPHCPTPIRILERRLVKKGNKAVTQVLVEWSGLGKEYSTWEYLTALQQRLVELLRFCSKRPKRL
ncbi:unnamed protein product [Cuscuta campestris]|uniref:Reverse transcriptase domain-containing protein n=1 Tax=Cuscuta campestris TaxID=132261 RepID=A0A484LZS6_9ASTE|nr:unnamed protein product [Cuscuta campestris]